jgi:hypothetical protein
MYLGVIPFLWDGGARRIILDTVEKQAIEFVLEIRHV